MFLIGPTGIGKTWLARALGQKACRDGYTALFIKASELFRDLAIAHADGSHRKQLYRLGRVDVLIVDADGRPLHLPEVCAAIGVSERTLRLHCLEHLGLSPHRYLLLRRMNQARRALAEANPTGTTVTAVATEFGFWELGRFSVAYRNLFGEPPSVTLHRAA